VALDAQALWAEKYAARFADAKFQEDEAREQAFIDDTFVVYGERLRGMTPRDLLHLQVVQSPIIYSTGKITVAHVLQFLWALHTRNKGTFRFIHRKRMMRRVLSRRSSDPETAAIMEISEYIGKMFMDSGGKSSGESKPIGACWLAPIMVRLSQAVGPLDPLDGRAWADVPLPRIWQYLKAVRVMEDPKAKDYSPSDKILMEWQLEMNQSQNGI
jgi:hypothetical protein